MGVNQGKWRVLLKQETWDPWDPWESHRHRRVKWVATERRFRRKRDAMHYKSRLVKEGLTVVVAHEKQVKALLLLLNG